MIKNLKILNKVILFLVLVLGVSSYYSYVGINSEKELKKEALQMISESEWIYFVGVVSENYQKSYDFIEEIGIKCRKDILSLEYYINNRDLFIEDMYNFDKDNHTIVNIIGNNIKGKFLNDIENDNNDPFALTKKDGIISDFSLNCSSDGRLRTFEEEYKIHYSPVLAIEAISRIQNQFIPTIKNGMKEDPIGWSFLEPKEGIELVDSFTWVKLKEKFQKYGLKGMSSYEWLYPYYIDPDKDLLGKHNVNPAGIKQETKQIILVSGFNVVDIINKNRNHTSAFINFDKERKFVEKTYNSSIIFKQTMTISNIILFFLTFLFFSSYYNREIDFMRLKIEDSENNELLEDQKE